MFCINNVFTRFYLDKNRFTFYVLYILLVKKTKHNLSLVLLHARLPSLQQKNGVLQPLEPALHILLRVSPRPLLPSPDAPVAAPPRSIQPLPALSSFSWGFVDLSR